MALCVCCCKRLQLGLQQKTCISSQWWETGKLTRPRHWRELALSKSCSPTNQKKVRRRAGVANTTVPIERGTRRSTRGSQRVWTRVHLYGAPPQCLGGQTSPKQRLKRAGAPSPALTMSRSIVPTEVVANASRSWGEVSSNQMKMLSSVLTGKSKKLASRLRCRCRVALACKPHHRTHGERRSDDEEE